MPDKIVKEISTVISAVDQSAPGVDSFEKRWKKMADDVPAYIAGKTFDDQKQLDSMSKFYARQAAEAEKLRHIDRNAEEQSIRDLQAAKIRSMRETAQQARIEAEANRRLFGDPAIENVGAAGKDMGAKIAEETEQGFLDSLNARFGRGSFAGQLTRLFRGSGPLLALGLAAHEFDAFATQIKDINQQVATGALRAGELPERYAEAIPIIGYIEKGFRSIGEVVTGIASDSVTWNAELKAVSETYGSIRDMAKETADYVKDSDRRIHGPTPADEVNNRADDKIKSIIEKASETRSRLAAESAAAQNNLEDLQQTSYGATGLDILEHRIKQPQIIEARSRMDSAQDDINTTNKAQAIDIKQIEEHRGKELEDVRQKQSIESRAKRVSEQNQLNSEIRRAQSQANIAQIEQQQHFLEDQAAGLKEGDINRLGILKQAADVERNAAIAKIDERYRDEKEEIEKRRQDHVHSGADYNQAGATANFDTDAAANQAEADRQRARDDDEKKKRGLDQNYQKGVQDDEKKKQDDQRSLMDHQLDVAEQLNKFKIDEARATGQLSKSDEARLAVADKFLSKQKDLQKIVNDPNATQGERDQAKSYLNRLPADEAAAERQAVRDSIGPRKAKAAGGDAGDLHGLAEKAQTAAESPEARGIKRSNDLLEKIHQLLAHQNPTMPANEVTM